jgi:hypothetical protein
LRGELCAAADPAGGDAGAPSGLDGPGFERWRLRGGGGVAPQGSAAFLKKSSKKLLFTGCFGDAIANTPHLAEVFCCFFFQNRSACFLCRMARLAARAGIDKNVRPREWGSQEAAPIAWSVRF